MKFRVTKNDFPYHLSLLCNDLAGIHSFSFENTLKSGFKNTGIFPYDPAVIRATVDLNLTSFDKPHPEHAAVPEILDENDESLKFIGQVLEVNRKMDPAKIVACQKAIKAIESGGKYAIEEVLEAHGRAFATVKPKKQRCLKDQRLAVDKGEILLKDEFLKALEDREVAKGAAKQKRKVPVPKKSEEIPKTIRKRSAKSAKKVWIS